MLGAMIGGALVGGALNLFGQRQNRIAQQRVNRDQMNFSREQLGHQLAQQRYSNRFAREQFNEQKHQARHGISMRIKDAKESGVHSLAALGINPASGGAPISVGDGPSVSNPYQSASSSGSSALASMGQDITRAVLSTRSQQDRQFNVALRSEQLKNARLENQVLAGQLRQLNNPPMPSVNKPQEVTMHHPDAPEQTPKPTTSVQFIRTGTGLMPVPSEDAKNSMEDMLVPDMVWSAKQYMGTGPKPAMKPPKGTEWVWNQPQFEWQAMSPGQKRNFHKFMNDWEVPKAKKHPYSKKHKKYFQGTRN
jgi:hypothetical protein